MDSENLPPTNKGRSFEIRAIALRDFAGLRGDRERLNPFDLAKYAKLLVVPFAAVQDLLDEETARHLLGDGKDKWSGGACGLPLPDGRKLIILNPTHSPLRHNSTLMEEIAHVFLGHEPSRLAIENTNSKGEAIARDYHAEIEEQAYSVGAAALVPYSGLRSLIKEGKTSRQIAQHYNVSRELIEYRMKVSRLWQNYLEKVKGNNAFDEEG